MTMSLKDIQTFSQKIDPNHAKSPHYYIHPLNEEITELSNITLETYHIPTNKLSDIHAVLQMRYPNKSYRLKCKANITANNGIICIYSHSDRPTILTVKPHETNISGNYLINTNHIPPVSCDHLSITQAIRTMNTNIHEKFNFMQMDTNTIYGQNDITRKIYPFNRKDIYLRFEVNNTQYNQDIAIDIDVYQNNNSIHYVSLIIPRDKIHVIESLIMHAGHNILAHMQEYPHFYCPNNHSQHSYIELLRCTQKYFAQPNNSLVQHTRRCVQDMLNHYTYQP